MYFHHLQGQRVSQACNTQAACKESLACCLLRLFFDPEDGGSIFLQNISKLLPDTFTADSTLHIHCLQLSVLHITVLVRAAIYGTNDNLSSFLHIYRIKKEERGMQYEEAMYTE
jgi:hypothetical protein